jgi:hypothetical protein
MEKLNVSRLSQLVGCEGMNVGEHGPTSLCVGGSPAVIGLVLSGLTQYSGASTPSSEPRNAL